MTLAREMALESEYVMGTFARKPWNSSKATA